jgi:hypothetical protein
MIKMCITIVFRRVHKIAKSYYYHCRVCLSILHGITRLWSNFDEILSLSTVENLTIKLKFH